MAAKIMELRQSRTDRSTEARSMLERADAEGRDLTGKEAKRFDEVTAELRDIEAEIEAEEKLIDADRAVAEARLGIAGEAGSGHRYFSMFPHVERSNDGFETF